MRATSGKRGGLPCPFENRKKCPYFGKKGSYYVHLWVKFSIQNLVLNRSALVPQTSRPLPWKISSCAPALRYYSFCKMLHHQCLTVFWIRLCLDSCSVVCTVTLCYVLPQTHSEFWNIQHHVFVCFLFSFCFVLLVLFVVVFFFCCCCCCYYMPAYSIIFSVIIAYSGILRQN